MLAQEKMLTDCEFRNKCRTKWPTLLMGLAAGVVGTLVIQDFTHGR